MNWQVAFSSSALKHFTRIASITTALLVAGFLIGIWLTTFSRESVRPPQEFIDQTKFSIYLPEKLPNNYKIEKDSFTLADGTLVFKASDGANGSIIFTEQEKPTSLNFADFYAHQIAGAETLVNTSYPTVYGTSSVTGASLVSVVTDTTWIMVTTQSPIIKEDLKAIANTLQRIQ